MDIGNSLQTAADRFFGFLPNLVGCLVLLAIGFIVAKVVQVAVRKGLEMTGVDHHLQRSSAHTYVDKVMPGVKVSGAVSRVVFWFIFLFFAVAAVSALQIPALTTFMNQVLAFLPNIVVAIAIFVVAALISGAVAAGITRIMGDTPTGKIVATVLPAVVMVVALFMILEQLQIAPEIVRIAFAATMGALALGLALAFGLGGRSVAQRMLEDAYAKGREQSAQVKRDIQTGKARAEEQLHGHSATAGQQTAPPPAERPTAYSTATSTQQYPAPPTGDTGGWDGGDGRHQA
ncbi:transporter [Nocardioides albidus]|uniref:Transporter n=1 Tax=Nocardioides albidus TaxID=1517589 RepID=A0A5C4VNJ4_9ACTN|nr:transporter [Nocardioides albidus]TNM37483.1 transporter [Nocardioides albidus]